MEALIAKEAELEGLLAEREDALAAASASVDKLTAEERELSATLAKMKEEERRRKEEEGLLRQKLELAEDKVKVSFQGHVCSFPIFRPAYFPCFAIRRFCFRLPQWKIREENGRRGAEWELATAFCSKTNHAGFRKAGSNQRVQTCLPAAASYLQTHASTGGVQPGPTIDGLECT